MECVLLTLQLKPMVCFITHITHNFPKLFFADSVMWSPWRAECWGPCRPLPESTEHLLPTAVRATASWWRHRGTLCPPQCVTSIPRPWTKPQASRMGLACLLMFFPSHGVTSLWTQSWVSQISIWDKWTWVQPWPDWLKPAHKANPGPLLDSNGDQDASWKASASDNWSFFTLTGKLNCKKTEPQWR